MNEKVEEIGAKDTHFVTPHGLDKEGHYSTAYDLTLIAKYLLEIPYLANIVSQKSIMLKINDYDRLFTTTNEMLNTYNGANGVKTGFTGEAGRCIVTSVTQNGRTLISVVLGCDTKKNRTMDSTKLMNYGFKSFEIVNIGEYLKENICIKVDKSIEEIYKISQKVEFKYPLLKGEREKIEIKYNICNNLSAPIYKGENIATAEICLNGMRIGYINYSLPESILKKEWKMYFKEIFLNSLKI